MSVTTLSTGSKSVVSFFILLDRVVSFWLQLLLRKVMGVCSLLLPTQIVLSLDSGSEQPNKDNSNGD